VSDTCVVTKLMLMVWRQAACCAPTSKREIESAPAEASSGHVLARAYTSLARRAFCAYCKCNKPCHPECQTQQDFLDECSCNTNSCGSNSQREREQRLVSSLDTRDEA
jgi:hypothetical protein